MSWHRSTGDPLVDRGYTLRHPRVHMAPCGGCERTIYLVPQETEQGWEKVWVHPFTGEWSPTPEPHMAIPR